jgi:cation diffusion facilitator CzcD-associated flavoprotein CzcO
MLGTDVVDIAIIGAGPYGLSLAANLRGNGRSVRIFGSPMRSWSHHMPKGMHLKSEGFASNLHDPADSFTLEHFCAERGIPYAHIGLPVHIDTFIEYGKEFQRRFAPQMEDTLMESLRQVDQQFELKTTAGETFRARQVVVAAGIVNFAYVPPSLTHLGSLISHSSEHAELEKFKGRKVAVLGAGASAIDLAALLRQAGAAVEVVARRPAIAFHNPPDEPRPLLRRITVPRSGLGLGWRSRMATDLPRVFHALPESLRIRIVAKHLGPAPGWFVRDAVAGLPMHLGVGIADSKARNGQATLTLRSPDRPEVEVTADHVIAATGYKVSVARLPFIDDALRSRILTADEAPVLNRHFESSVPRLYFIGTAAANSFGPLLRFAYGAEYTAKRVAARLGT